MFFINTLCFVEKKVPQLVIVCCSIKETFEICVQLMQSSIQTKYFTLSILNMKQNKNTLSKNYLSGMLHQLWEITWC